jgi:hypothetical protein
MESQLKSLFRKTILTLGAWMLVLMAIQGAGIYYLVTKFTDHKIAAQTAEITKQTNELVAEMKNLPSSDELKALGDNVEKIEKEMGSRIETMERDVIKDLTPTLRTKSQKPYYVSGSQIKYFYSIENKGKYPVNISNVKFHLSTAKIDSPDKIRDQLILNKDYRLVTNTNSEDITPGEEAKREVTIELTSPKKIPEALYYCVTFDAQTDPNIIKSVKNIDKEKISNRKFYYLLGDIVTPG